ncbi:MAG TPA: nuclear transport factor 2 family protein [Gammaproteobacteria bacterium]|jgi:hypothetical protein
MRVIGFLGAASACAAVLVVGMGWAQQAASPSARLTADDRAEIVELIYRYGHALDTCANNGYDYADLYTADGVFVDAFSDDGFARGGVVRATGREQLARAAGGGELGCRDVGWKDWLHVMVNPVITPTAEGASGRVYTIVLGAEGPDAQRFGGYEDEYIKTADGWRIKRRTHVRNKAWSHPLLRSEDLN